MSSNPPPSFHDFAIDFATIFFVAGLLCLSFFSIFFIFHLRFKSRSSRHLQNFNSLWTFRFLFVFFITSWSFSELIRLPLFRRNYFYPLLSELTVTQQANLCNLHLVLSLGVFEPGFLVTLLFLLDVSVKTTSRPRTFFSVFSVLASCVPIFLLQVHVVFFPGYSKMHFPEPFYKSWFLSWDSHDHEIVLCSYPLLSTILFGLRFFLYHVAPAIVLESLVSRNQQGPEGADLRPRFDAQHWFAVADPADGVFHVLNTEKHCFQWSCSARVPYHVHVRGGRRGNFGHPTDR